MHSTRTYQKTWSAERIVYASYAQLQHRAFSELNSGGEVKNEGVGGIENRILITTKIIEKIFVYYFFLRTPKIQSQKMIRSGVESGSIISRVVLSGGGGDTSEVCGVRSLAKCLTEKSMKWRGKV